MPTPTARIKAERQDPNSNKDVWGSEQNTGTLDIIDEAFGFQSVAVAAPVTLTIANYSSDVGRRLGLQLTGVGGFKVTLPSVEKLWIFWNACTNPVTVGTASGNTITLRVGQNAWVGCDGTNIIADDMALDKIKPPVAAVAMNGQKITGALGGTNPGDVVTWDQIGSFATAAQQSATNAAASESNAATSATNASASVTLAQNWAVSLTTFTGSGGLFGARKYAQDAANSALLAAGDGFANDAIWFGDGSDGDLTASSGTTTLTRDTYYNNVTLSGPAIIDPAGYRLHVRGVLDISGLTSGFIGRPAPSASGQTAGIALAAGSLPGGIAGGAGGNGGTAAGVQGGVGTAGTLGSGGSSTGAGGAGGNGNGTSGGASRAAVTGTTYRLRRAVIDAFRGATLINGGVASGPGGSGGGGDTANSGGAGGGGGGAGAIVLVFARTINRSASTVAAAIQSRGGDGASGTNGAASVNGTGGGAGGAGGAGGWVQVVYRFLTGTASTNTIDARGGNGGNGGTKSGTNGIDGRGGGAGFGGFVSTYNLSTGVATSLIGTQSSVAPTTAAGETAATTAVSL